MYERGCRIDVERRTYNDEYIGFLSQTYCFFEHRHSLAKPDYMRTQLEAFLALITDFHLVSIGREFVYEVVEPLGTHLREFAVQVYYVFRAGTFVQIVDDTSCRSQISI